MSRPTRLKILPKRYDDFVCPVTSDDEKTKKLAVSSSESKRSLKPTKSSIIVEQNLNLSLPTKTVKTPARSGRMTAKSAIGKEKELKIDCLTENKNGTLKKDLSERPAKAKSKANDTDTKTQIKENQTDDSLPVKSSLSAKESKESEKQASNAEKVAQRKHSPSKQNLSGKPAKGESKANDANIKTEIQQDHTDVSLPLKSSFSATDSKESEKQASNVKKVAKRKQKFKKESESLGSSLSPEAEIVLAEARAKLDKLNSSQQAKVTNVSTTPKKEPEEDIKIVYHSEPVLSVPTGPAKPFIWAKPLPYVPTSMPSYSRAAPKSSCNKISKERKISQLGELRFRPIPMVPKPVGLPSLTKRKISVPGELLATENPKIRKRKKKDGIMSFSPDCCPYFGEVVYEKILSLEEPCYVPGELLPCPENIHPMFNPNNSLIQRRSLHSAKSGTAIGNLLVCTNGSRR